jgi:hypothetical protein
MTKPNSVSVQIDSVGYKFAQSAPFRTSLVKPELHEFSAIRYIKVNTVRNPLTTSNLNSFVSNLIFIRSIFNIVGKIVD